METGPTFSKKRTTTKTNETIFFFKGKTKRPKKTMPHRFRGNRSRFLGFFLFFGKSVSFFKPLPKESQKNTLGNANQ